MHNKELCTLLKKWEYTLDNEFYKIMQQIDFKNKK